MKNQILFFVFVVLCFVFQGQMQAQELKLGTVEKIFFKESPQKDSIYVLHQEIDNSLVNGGANCYKEQNQECITILGTLVIPLDFKEKSNKIILSCFTTDPKFNSTIGDYRKLWENRGKKIYLFTQLLERRFSWDMFFASHDYTREFYLTISHNGLVGLEYENIPPKREVYWVSTIIWMVVVPIICLLMFYLIYFGDIVGGFFTRELVWKTILWGSCLGLYFLAVLYVRQDWGVPKNFFGSNSNVPYEYSQYTIVWDVHWVFPILCGVFVVFLVPLFLYTRSRLPLFLSRITPEKK